MASTTKPVVFQFITMLVVVLVLLATTSPTANADVTLANVGQILLSGNTTCSAAVTAKCVACAPMANLKLDVTNRGSIIASATTSRDGFFQMDLTGKLTNLKVGRGNVVKDVRVVAKLPIAGCTMWAHASGHLVGNVVLKQTRKDVQSVALVTFLGVGPMVRVG